MTKKTPSEPPAATRHTSTLGALVRELMAEGKVMSAGMFNVFDEAGFDEAGSAVTKTIRHAFDDAHHALARAYSAHVCELAALARAAILPYFSEHRLTYKVSTSVDTWHIANERGRSVSDDALPAYVHAVLDFPVASICLGFHLEEIKPADWIAKKVSKRSR